MRKDALLMLVTKTNDEKRSYIMNRLFKTEPYSLMSDEEDISFKAFKDYLKVYFYFLDFNQFQKDFSEEKTDEELFSFFLKLPVVVKSIDEKPMIVQISNEKSTLDRTPQLPVVAKRLDEKLSVVQISNVKSNLDRQSKDIKHNISSFLDIKDRETLSITSKAFYSNINDWVSHWKNKLLEAGCNKELLEKVSNTHVIKNYKNLYRGFIKIPFSDRVKMNDPWELYCLSGDPRAINYAIQNENLTAQTRNARGETAFHLTTLSGSLSAMTIVLTMKGIDPLAEGEDYRTAYDYAARSGSAAAMAKALKVKGMDPLAYNSDGKTAYHHAAMSGSPAAMAKALEVKGMNPFVKDFKGKTAYHHAAMSGSPAAMAKALEVKGMDPLVKDRLGMTAYHHAALSGSAAAMAKALEVEGMDPLAEDLVYRTAYHYAALSGSPAAMAKALEVKGVGFFAHFRTPLETEAVNPLAKDRNGMTAYHYAARSGSPAAMAKALEVKGMDPLVKDELGMTAYHHAAKSGSAAAMAKALEVEGIDPLAKDRYGRTAYHHAALSGSLAAMTKALEVKGMNPLAEDLQGRTAYQYALHGSNTMGRRYGSSSRYAKSGSPAARNKALEIEKEAKALEVQGMLPLVKIDSNEKTNYSAATSGSMNAVDSKYVQSESNNAKSDVKKSSFSSSPICKKIIEAINIEIDRFKFCNTFYTIGMTRKETHLKNALEDACKNMQNMESIEEFLEFTANPQSRSLKQILQEPRKWPGSTPLYGKADSWRKIEELILKFNKENDTSINMRKN